MSSPAPTSTPLPSLQAPFQVGYPVPRPIFDAFEAVMRANMRRLAKDIATTLNQPEAPLLDALLKGPAASVRPYIVEESADDEREISARCDYLCQGPAAPAFLQPCGRPILWVGTGTACRCPEHLYSLPLERAQVKGLPTVWPLTKEELEEIGSEEPLFIAVDGTVTDAHHIVRGHMDFPTGNLTLIDE